MTAKKDERMVKALLVTYHVEVDAPGSPSGKALAERLVHLGDIVDASEIPPAELDRLERAGAFYSVEDHKAIKAGKYKGPDAASVRAALNDARVIQPLDEEVEETAAEFDLESMSDEQVAQYILDNNLNVDKTLALAENATSDQLEKLLDAESLVANTNEADPRKGVVKGIEAKLSALTTG